MKRTVITLESVDGKGIINPQRWADIHDSWTPYERSYNLAMMMNGAAVKVPVNDGLNVLIRMEVQE